MGTLKNALYNLLGYSDTNRASRRFRTSNNVLFTSFGKDVTASDIVKTAIHRNCEEISKCKFKSVLIRNQIKGVEVLDDDVNAVLSSRVNPFCGLKDFLYKCAYLTYTNDNCFIYRQYEEVPINGTPYVKRVTKAFYPIEKALAKIYTTTEGEVRIELSNNNTVFDMPYSDIIHIRRHYGQNPFLGGDANGMANFDSALKDLQTVQVIKESIPKAIKSSLSLKGVLSMKTVADIDKKEVTREEFEQHLFSSEYGIVATDYESDFTPVNISATDIPTNILSFLREELLAPFGVSLPIYLGKYNDDEFTAHYQTEVEGWLMAFAEAMQIVVFTPRQLAYGHQIKYYDRLVQSLSYDRRQKLVEMTKDDALLGRGERRELLGYEPDEEPTRVSLNYIDVAIANQYQLDALKNGEKLKTKIIQDDKENEKGKEVK